MRLLPADPRTLLMDDTSLENTFTCQPQQRNVHGRVFGGFLMRWVVAPQAMVWAVKCYAHGAKHQKCCSRAWQHASAASCRIC